MSGTSGESDIASVPAGDASRAESALQGLYEISKILAAPGRLEAVQSNVLKTLSRFVEMRRGMIALIDETGQPTAAVSLGWGDGDVKAQYLSLPKGLAGRLFAGRHPFVVSDSERDPLLADWPGERPATVIAAPIEQRDRVVAR